MKIEVTETYDSFLSMAEEWNGLLRKSKNNEICQTHEWFKCWWDGYGSGKQPFIISVRENRELIAIAPLCTFDSTYRGVLKTRNVNSCLSGISPHSDFICLPGREKEGITSIIEYLLENKFLWNVGSFERIPLDSVNWDTLCAALEEKAARFRIIKSMDSPFITVRGDWKVFYGSRSKKFRKAMRNRLNRCEGEGRFEISKFEDSNEIEQLWPAICEISSNSWKNARGKSIPRDEKQTTFYKEMNRICGERGWIRIWILKMNGRYIAFEYHMIYEGKVFVLRADFDEAYKALSPGAVLEYNIIKWHFEKQDIREYDFCADDYLYLSNWTAEKRSHGSIRFFNARALSRILGLTECNLVPFAKKAHGFLTPFSRAQKAASVRTDS